MYLYLMGVIPKAPFILAVTETWISPKDVISLVFLKGYSVFLTCIPGTTSLELRWVIFLYLSHFYFSSSPEAANFTLSILWWFWPPLTVTFQHHPVTILSDGSQYFTVNASIPSPFNSRTSPPVITFPTLLQPPTLCSYK